MSTIKVYAVIRTSEAHPCWEHLVGVYGDKEQAADVVAMCTHDGNGWDYEVRLITVNLINLEPQDVTD